MSKEPWASIGITGETRFLQLLFDPLSKSLIVQFYREIQDPYGVKTLYTRHTSEDRYHRISEKTDRLSFESPVLSPSGSHFFVNVWEAEKIDGKYTGFDWNSIRNIDITSNEVISTIENGELAVDEPYFRGWISDIFGASADGEMVYCSVGLQIKTGETGGKVDYYLANVSLMNKNYEIITKLNNVFL